MLKLNATFIQWKDLTWDAVIDEYPNIRVAKAEDLESARTILKIITAEEIAYIHHTRKRWDITTEVIRYFK